MSATDRTLREESVRQRCRLLRLPTVAAQFGRLADEATSFAGPVNVINFMRATGPKRGGVMDSAHPKRSTASIAILVTLTLAVWGPELDRKSCVWQYRNYVMSIREDGASNLWGRHVRPWTAPVRPANGEIQNLSAQSGRSL